MRKTIRSFGAIICALFLTSCLPDGVVAPGRALVGPANEFVDAGHPPNKQSQDFTAGLVRSAPLPEALTVSKVIDAAGGTISIPAAGVTITVPAGALGAATQISVTARKGRLIAYDFQPHGTRFAKPLTITQQLLSTNAASYDPALLKLGYYESPLHLTSDGGTISEAIDGTVNSASRVFTSTISHFSGYLVSCGRQVALSEDGT